MLDIKWIRDHPQDLDTALSKRGMEPLSHKILEWDSHLRTTLTALQEKQNARNSLAKTIGQKKAQQEGVEELLGSSQRLKEEIAALEETERTLRHSLEEVLVRLPNSPNVEVPVGETADHNQEIRTWGTPLTYAFEPKRHFHIGEALGLMDFEGAARVAGARFVILKGDLVRLERALANFMLDLHTEEFGYEPVSPPLLVRDETVFGVGQLPKFSEDLFKTTDGRWLISTAEVPLTNLVRDSMVDATLLPLRYTACTPCFRSEAGAAGRDTRGMIRNHQFYKVELVSIVHPQDSENEHQRMLSAAEEVLKRLGLPYRVMLLCSGDMGATASKTYDLEVWLPGENTYREISSCSNTQDYQARRMNARFKDSASPKGSVGFVHTLNGSGVAVGRALVAVLENYQQEDGSVVIPSVLRPYMKGQEVIKRHA